MTKHVYISLMEGLCVCVCDACCVCVCVCVCVVRVVCVYVCVVHVVCGVLCVCVVCCVCVWCVLCGCVSPVGCVFPSIPTPTPNLSPPSCSLYMHALTVFSRAHVPDPMQHPVAPCTHDASEEAPPVVPWWSISSKCFILRA